MGHLKRRSMSLILSAPQGGCCGKVCIDWTGNITDRPQGEVKVSLGCCGMMGLRSGCSR